MDRRAPVWEVIKAVVTRLKATTTVTDLATGGIYNNVEQGTAYPYVVVTAPTNVRKDTLGTFGQSLLVDVRAVSQYRGDKDAATILDRCVESLNRQTLSMTGHRTLGLTWESGEQLPGEVVGGIQTRHHIATFRAWTEQTS